MVFRSQIATHSFSSSLPSESTLESDNNFAPWLELPDHLIEKILERLPILDYIRFGGVCRHWCNIHVNHRHHHAPSPPPMINLPWFIPKKPQQEPVDCFSPFEHRSHRIMLPLSPKYLERGIKSNDRWTSYPPNGWLTLEEFSDYKNYCYTLLNPFSSKPIEIDAGYYFNLGFRFSKLILSPPPGYFVFRISSSQHCMYIDLFREGDEGWTMLDFPHEKMERDSLDETSAIIWKERVYYMSWKWGLSVIDPLLCEPTVEFVEMDESPLLAYRQGWEDEFFPINLFMVESDGRILLVLKFFGFYFGAYGDLEVKSFEVFEADLPNKRWLRVESLGDRVVFIHKKFICSLFAEDVGVEGNCIYYQDLSKIEQGEFPDSVPWGVFNLGTRKLTESLLPHAPTYHTHFMFVPSLC